MTKHKRIHFQPLEYGFEYGAAKVTRLLSSPKQGWVVMGLDTPKATLQLYVTKTGKVRVYDGASREWFPGLASKG